jgi:hypothetical protein
MPNKGTDSTATMMIVVDEVDPSTDPKTYQYVYVGNINDLPSDVLTEESIVNDLSTGGTNKPLSAEQGRTLNSHVNYTTCGSGAADQVKLISDDGFELSTHLRLLVLMANTNTHATPKFNINGTGAKDLWYNGAVASDTNSWSAGEVLDVYYDGIKYIANTHGGAQFSTGEKVGNVGIDDEPTAGGENLVKSGGINKDINTKASITQNGIVSLSDMILYNGFFDADHETLRVAGLEQAYYAVIKLNGNEFVRVEQPSSGALVFLKEFEYEPTMPYTLVKCDGQTVIRNYEGNVPTDARFLLIRIIDHTGTNVSPTILCVDNFDLTIDLVSQIRKLLVASSLFSEKNKLLLASNGSLASGTSWVCTDYLPVNPGEVVNITSNTYNVSSVAVCAFYTASKTYIANSSVVRNTDISTETATVPDNAVYMVCCTHKCYISRSYIDYSLVKHILSYVDNIAIGSNFNISKVVNNLGFTTNNVKIKGTKIPIKQNQSSVSNPFNRLGYVIGGSNGYETESATYAHTELLPIKDVPIKIGIQLNYNYAAVVFFNEYSECVGSLSISDIGGSLNEFCESVIDSSSIPANAKYFVVNTSKSVISDAYVIFGDENNRIQLPELLHTVNDSDLVREHKIYNQNTGVGTATNEIDAVRLNVSEGDILVVSGCVGTTTNYEMVGIYNEAGTSIKKCLYKEQINAKITIPANASYVICQSRISTHPENTRHLSLKVDLYSKYKKEAVKYIDYDALILEPAQGYYRKNLGFSCSYTTAGFRVSQIIPVMVGDIIIAGSSISYPFDTTAHLTFNAQKEVLSTLNMSNGTITITQAMWDAGVRYIAITYRPTDTPSLIVRRAADKEPFVLDKRLKMKITPYGSSLVNNGFMLWIPSAENGKYVGYHFAKCYKKWDSLTYEDAQGQTQTLTDVVSADVWNNYCVYNENSEEIIQGNTNFIFSLIDISAGDVGENFSGNGHGNEIASLTSFIINGIEYNDYVSPLTSRIIDIDSFECMWKANVYKAGAGVSEFPTAKPYLDTNGEKVLDAIHYLYAKFEYGNKITVENTLQIKRNNIKFSHLNGAMLESYWEKFSKVSVNNDEYTINAVADDGTFTLIGDSTINLGPGQGGTEVVGVSVKANWAKMWGKGFIVTQRMEPKLNSTTTKCGIYCHKYADRLKLYFHPVVTTKTESAIGQSADVFNSGDVISVINYREIEV